MLQQKKNIAVGEKIRSYKSLSKHNCFELDLKRLSISLHYAQFRNDAKHMSPFGPQKEHSKQDLKMVPKRNLESSR